MVDRYKCVNGHDRCFGGLARGPDCPTCEIRPPHTFELSKEWCRESAQIEGDAEIGAGGSLAERRDAQIQKLADLLERYGGHIDGCRMHRVGRCTCGWVSVQAEVEGIQKAAAPAPFTNTRS